MPRPCPRRHKKVKLRVLKFYKVDDSGKVQRLRKVCPQCGPGIFMATHFNRVYCGKCHLTCESGAGRRAGPGGRGGNAAGAGGGRGRCWYPSYGGESIGGVGLLPRALFWHKRWLCAVQEQG